MLNDENNKLLLNQKSFKKLMVISDGVNVTTIWEPEPMRGYSCLGHFATLGSNPPDKSQVACLPTECLVKSNTLAYVASFPAIDIIPSFANKNLKFCSFWSTPLNHLYCKVSTDNYYTNSLYKIIHLIMVVEDGRWNLGSKRKWNYQKRL